MSRPTHGSPRAAGATIARATASRGAQLVDEALAVAAVQRGALAAHRLGDQEALAAGDAGHRRGVELDELEVGERRRRRRGRAAGRSPRSPAGWSCATTARRRRRRRARPRARAAARRRRAGRRCSGRRPRSSAVARRPSRTSTAAWPTTSRRELAQDPPAGRAAAGVHDAPDASGRPRGRARRRPSAVGVEAHAESLEVVEARGRLVAQHLGGAAAHEAAAGGERVLEVLAGRVLDRERGGEAALRPVGRGLGERPGGDEGHPRALGGGAQRGEEAGGTGADDHEVRWVTGTTGVRYRRGCPLPRRSGCTTTRRSATRPRPPGAPGARSALEARDVPARLVRLERAEAPAVEREQLLAGAPGVARRVHRGAVRRAAAGRSTSTPRRGRRPGRRRRTPPAARSRWSTRCCPARRRGLLGAPPARPSRRARAGDGVLLLQQRRRRGRATPTAPTASSGCWSSTGTSTTATGRKDIFYDADDVLFRPIHQWPLYPGTGPASDVGTGAGEGFTVNLPVPARDGRRRVPLARRARRRAAGRAPTSRSSCSSPRGSTRTAPTRSPPAG